MRKRHRFQKQEADFIVLLTLTLKENVHSLLSMNSIFYFGLNSIQQIFYTSVCHAGVQRERATYVFAKCYIRILSPCIDE